MASVISNTVEKELRKSAMSLIAALDKGDEDETLLVLEGISGTADELITLAEDRDEAEDDEEVDEEIDDDEEEDEDEDA